jgi:hypothetical protein
LFTDVHDRTYTVRRLHRGVVRRRAHVRAVNSGSSFDSNPKCFDHDQKCAAVASAASAPVFPIRRAKRLARLSRKDRRRWGSGLEPLPGRQVVQWRAPLVTAPGAACAAPDPRLPRAYPQRGLARDSTVWAGGGQVFQALTLRRPKAAGQVTMRHVGRPWKAVSRVYGVSLRFPDPCWRAAGASQVRYRRVPWM